MSKRTIAILSIVLTLMFTLAALAYAATKTIVLKVGDPSMTVNGVKQEIDPGRGTKPVVIDGRTLVPIRTIVENMGGTVDWSDETQTVIISAGTKLISLTIGANMAYITDQNSAIPSQAVLEVASQTINGRTMVPVRFVTENLGASVTWDEGSQTVTISFEASDDTAKPASHTGQWTVSHGQTGRQDVDSCIGCHNETGTTIDSEGDRIADLARTNSLCYDCHMKRPHGEYWMGEHPTTAPEKGLQNCFTCHDKNLPGDNVTGTYCNTCHWFSS